MQAKIRDLIVKSFGILMRFRDLKYTFTLLNNIFKQKFPKNY